LDRPAFEQIFSFGNAVDYRPPGSTKAFFFVSLQWLLFIGTPPHAYITEAPPPPAPPPPPPPPSPPSRPLLEPQVALDAVFFTSTLTISFQLLVASRKTLNSPPRMIPQPHHQPTRLSQPLVDHRGQGFNFTQPRFFMGRGISFESFVEFSFILRRLPCRVGLSR